MQLYMCPFHYWLLAGVICGLKRVHARRARCDDKGRQNVANVLTLLSCSVLAFHDQMAKFEWSDNKLCDNTTASTQLFDPPVPKHFQWTPNLISDALQCNLFFVVGHSCFKRRIRNKQCFSHPSNWCAGQLRKLSNSLEQHCSTANCQERKVSHKNPDFGIFWKRCALLQGTGRPLRAHHFLKWQIVERSYTVYYNTVFWRRLPQPAKGISIRFLWRAKTSIHTQPKKTKLAWQNHRHHHHIMTTMI